MNGHESSVYKECFHIKLISFSISFFFFLFLSVILFIFLSFSSSCHFRHLWNGGIFGTQPILGKKKSNGKNWNHFFSFSLFFLFSLLLSFFLSFSFFFVLFLSSLDLDESHSWLEFWNGKLLPSSSSCSFSLLHFLVFSSFFLSFFITFLLGEKKMRGKKWILSFDDLNERPRFRCHLLDDCDPGLVHHENFHFLSFQTIPRLALIYTWNKMWREREGKLEWTFSSWLWYDW